MAAIFPAAFTSHGEQLMAARAFNLMQVSMMDQPAMRVPPLHAALIRAEFLFPFAFNLQYLFAALQAAMIFQSFIGNSIFAYSVAPAVCLNRIYGHANSLGYLLISQALLSKTNESLFFGIVHLYHLLP